MLISKKTVLIFFSTVILLAGIFMVAQPASAAPWKLVPDCGTSGCNVCDAIGVGINITKIMLGTLGSAALLMFIYGGVLMATSRGHSDQVQKGKDALINAVKGVIIVLGSWVVINYGLAAILGKNDLSKVSLFNQNQAWYQVDCPSSTTTSSSIATVKCEDLGAGYQCAITNIDYNNNYIAGLCDGGNNNVCVLSDLAAPCSGKNNGDGCGDQLACSVFDSGGGPIAQCVTECAYKYPTGTKVCKNTSAGSAIGCEIGLCPGSSNIKCCNK